MRTFLFGAAVGAIAMYFYLQGFGPVIAHRRRVGGIRSRRRTLRLYNSSPSAYRTAVALSEAAAERRSHRGHEGARHAARLRAARASSPRRRT